MTDRIHALTVILETDMRDDDCQKLIDSIAMLRGVLTVQRHVSDTTSMMAESRARHELGMKLINICFPKDRP